MAKINGTTLNCVWATHGGYAGTIPASGYAAGEGIAVDPTGPYCYATAYFRGTADFGNNANNQNVSVSRSGSLNDYLIVKLANATGLPGWAIAGDTPVLDDGETRGIAVDPDGNPCVTGFLHPGAANTGVNEGSTVMVRSYDATSAVLRWTRDATDGSGPPGAPQDLGLGIAADAAGCLHVTGQFTEDLEFAPVGQPVATPNSFDSHGRDLFVAKICPTCCPVRPVLKIARSGGNRVLSWDGPCCHLEVTDTLKGTFTVWTSVPGAPPVTLQNLGDQPQFFRLVCP